jgi:hypothetical protein
MNCEARHEFDVKYEGRVQKIREAAAAAIKQLDQLRCGTIAPQAFDAQVARIAQENLHRYGSDLTVHRMPDGATRFLIEDQNTGRRYDLIKSFFHRHDGLIPKAEAWFSVLDLEVTPSQPVEKILLAEQLRSPTSQRDK